MAVESDIEEMEKGMQETGRTVIGMVLELNFQPMEASSTEGNGRMEHLSTKVVSFSTTNFLTEGKNKEKNIFI